MSASEKLSLDAEKVKRAVEKNVDKEKLKQAFDVSHFGINTVIRGAQLTLVGGEYLILEIVFPC